jgi:hypothetical protein
MSKEAIQKLTAIIAFVLFLLPVALYLYKFGFGLWDKHEHWAEMGSFFSGVYSPIIAFIALLILLGQSIAQASLNQHQYDQTYIQENRKDLDFYIDKMESQLSKMTESGESVSDLLIRSLVNLNEEQLRSKEGEALTAAFYLKYRLIFDIWISIYPLLDGLATNDHYPYSHNFVSSKLKISTTLSWEACVALDKFYFSKADKIKANKLYYWDVGKK